VCIARTLYHQQPGRRIQRFERQAELDWLRAAGPTNRRPGRIAAADNILSEGSFADATNSDGFKRSHWRRLWRQQIQTTSSPPVKTSESCSETTDRSVPRLRDAPIASNQPSGNLWFVSCDGSALPVQLNRPSQPSQHLSGIPFWATRPKVMVNRGIWELEEHGEKEPAGRRRSQG